MTKQNNSQPRPWISFGLFPMLRDVLVTSLNKGQFPIACVFAVVIIIIVRLPENDLRNFVFDVFQKLENGYIAGWLLAFIISLGWYFNTKHIRKIHHREIDRISNEKRQLQEQLVGRKLPSSDIRKQNSKN